MKDAAWENFRFRELSCGAIKTAQLYREEAVALKAEAYYNSVVAEYAIQKEGRMQLDLRNRVVARLRQEY